MDEVRIINSTVSHTHTVVFLHGRGDNVANFTLALRYWWNSQGHTLGELFPSFKWVFPQAPNTDGSFTPGPRRWPQWFDVADVKDFSKQEELQAEGLRLSVARIRNILAQEAALLDNQWDHVILAGISQGAATSVHTLINLSLPAAPAIKGQRRLGAFLGFSCRMPFPGRSLSETRKILDLEDTPESDEVLRNTPMLLEHCVDDPLVSIEHGRDLWKTLNGFGAPVFGKEYPDGGHWFNAPRGMDDTVDFIQTYILGNIVDD